MTDPVAWALAALFYGVGVTFGVTAFIMIIVEWFRD